MRYPEFLNFFTKQYYYYSRILIFFIYPNITKQNIFYEVNKILCHNVVKNWRNNCHSKKDTSCSITCKLQQILFSFFFPKKHDQASLNDFAFEADYHLLLTFLGCLGWMHWMSWFDFFAELVSFHFFEQFHLRRLFSKLIFSDFFCRYVS